ncbi:hypothetical protein MB02_16260 [Croceicoccus estronivorus]|uniref:hypothetical protein n=1 Tax=Croceicoccus estronivorus TaxID=1172626 RepID=UPI00082BAC6C|nr:hypothetical protein [Croceicoccus estronivorus]OCC22565.1 hypothetical protein MB02_16260 [Croceicoccus estronivorus]
MAQTVAFYIERAEESAEEARNATLENVKARALRSEASWRQMASRARSVEENRARRDREKVASAATDISPCNEQK